MENNELNELKNICFTDYPDVVGISQIFDNFDYLILIFFGYIYLSAEIVYFQATREKI